MPVEGIYADAQGCVVLVLPVSSDGKGRCVAWNAHGAYPVSDEHRFGRGWIRRVEATSDEHVLRMVGDSESGGDDESGFVRPWQRDDATRQLLSISWEATERDEGDEVGLVQWRQLHVVPSQLSHIRRPPLFSLFFVHLVASAMRWVWSVLRGLVSKSVW